LPTLNNTNDIVKISVNGETLDSLLYSSSWGEKGKSLERINYFKPSNSNDNWGISTRTATPTKVNSIAQYLDLAIVSTTLDDNGLKLVLENLGNNSADSLYLAFSVNGELMAEQRLAGLASQSDNAYFLGFATIGYSPQSNDKIELNINSDFDINTNNNYYIFYVGKITKQGDVLVNEIMYDIDDNHFEFIELYNNTDTEIQLSNWYIAEETDIKNNRYNLIRTSAILLPKDYLLIISDSTAINFFDESQQSKLLFTERKLALNKSSDIICLFNERKQLIDSLAYSDSWQESYLKDTKNISLEKVKPGLASATAGHWKSCADESGSTPLLANSYYKETVNNANITANPNPFSPTSSNSPYIVIEFELPFDNALLDCDIYYSNGAKALSLVKSKYISKSGVLTWNGRDENGRVFPLGAYVAVIEATNQTTGKAETLKIAIVLAQ
jgi:hypothetical protein